MATVTLNPSADNYIEDTAATTNFGTSGSMYVGEYNAGAQIARALVKFDLSSIPAGSTITSATFRVKDVGTDFTDNARTMRVYRCLRAWTETGSTWNTYDGTNNWGTAGANNTTTDREATDIGSVALPNPPSAGTYYDITLTTSKVQEWLDGVLTNNGLVLKMDTETNDMHRFYTVNTGTPTDRPELVVVYTAPSTKKFALLGVG